MTGLPPTAVAGVITTRGAASAFFVNGTNRAMFRFTMINHLCNDLPTVMDTTRPPDRIRQDVTRSPGGVSTLFLTNCIGCHSGMDPMAQAFAYYNFSYPASEIGATAWPIGNIVYTPGQTQPKYHINNTNFPQGFNTPDDSWNNRWRTGPNQVLGWSASLPGSGQGAQSLGQELEGSRHSPAARYPGIQDGLLPRTGDEQRRERGRRRCADSVDDYLVPIEQLLVAAGVR